MFLDRLSGVEKTMFLDLAAYAAKCNGIVDNLENELLYQYGQELGIESYDYSEPHHSIEEIKEHFSNINKSKKRIVILELLGMCCIDGDYDNKEREFVSEIATDIGIDKETFKMLSQDINEYITILGIIEDHIDG